MHICIRPRTAASFFLNFLVQQIFFFLPVGDVLAIGPLLVLPLTYLIRACAYCCCSCCCKKVGAGLRTFKLHANLQNLMYPIFYGRSELISNIGYVFACIAPVVVVPVILWFTLASILWPYNLKFIFKPKEGKKFDSGGVFWPTVASQQLAALIVAQLAVRRRLPASRPRRVRVVRGTRVHMVIKYSCRTPPHSNAHLGSSRPSTC